MGTSEDYKSALENLIKNADADGYEFWIEVRGEVVDGQYGEAFDLGSATMTFAKKHNGDYASADENLYFIGMA